MSIGGSAAFSDYPTAEAATNLSAKGVIVVSSQGNGGAFGGLFWVNSPAAARQVRPFVIEAAV